MTKNTFQFLKQLDKNNNRDWFEQNRPAYENAKKEVTRFAEEMINLLAVEEPGFAELKAQQCMFRINRDVRFSKDKRPYKNNLGVYFNTQGKKSETGGYYVHIQPGNSFIAAGIWHPSPQVLAAVRQEIDYNFDEWKKIVDSRSFIKSISAPVTENETLTRPPKGYDADNPAIEYIKLKSIIASKKLDDDFLMHSSAPANTMKLLKNYTPMLQFVNRAISDI